MFHNISNPKWFGNWSRLEDDYLGNGGTDIADNFTFSKMEKTGGLFGSIIRLATAFPACDPETGHATGAWKVACESIDLDEVPLSDIADMISGFDCETITDFRLFNTGAFDNTPWQQALGELLLRPRVEKDDYQWIQCPNSESAVNMMNMVMDAHMPKDFFDDFVCDTPEIFLKTGFEQRPMLYTQKHLFQALTPKSDYNPHRHGFSIEQVKRFPELLASPVVLANSPTRDDVLLAILLATDAYDTPLIAGIKPDGTGNYGEREVETNMVLSVYSRQNFIRYFALLRDMDAFVFVSGRKIEALEDLSGLPLAENCSGLDIDRILQRPKCLG